MYGLILAVVLGQQAPIVASPERQKQLLAEINARQADQVPKGRLVGDQGVKIGDQGVKIGVQGVPNDDGVSPGDLANPKTKAAPKSKAKARYRAYNARFEAEQAAEAKRLREYQAKMAPIWAAQQERQQELQLRQYEIELRHRDNLDFNDAIRGVTRPR